MIDRKMFLEMCRQCTYMAQRGDKDFPDCLLVKVKGHKYYPVGYAITFDKNGDLQHNAVVHALKANSVVWCLLADVKLVEE